MPKAEVKQVVPLQDDSAEIKKDIRAAKIFALNEFRKIWARMKALENHKHDRLTGLPTVGIGTVEAAMEIGQDIEKERAKDEKLSTGK